MSSDNLRYDINQAIVDAMATDFIISNTPNTVIFVSFQLSKCHLAGIALKGYSNKYLKLRLTMLNIFI